MQGRNNFFWRFSAVLKMVLTYCLFFLFSPAAISQNTIDKIVALNRLSDSLSRVDANEAKKVADESLELSLKIKNDTLEYASRFQKAVANYFVGNLNVALEDFIKNKKLAQKLNNPVKIIESLNAIGNVYKDIDRYDMALNSYKEALDLCYATNDGTKMYLVESNIAISLNYLKQYDSSIYYCKHILTKLKNHLSKDVGFIASVYSTILTNYIDLKNNDSINKYAAIVLKMTKESGDMLNYSGSLYNLGMYYNKTNDFSRALTYLDEAEKNDQDNLQLKLNITQSKGIAYNGLKRYEDAAEMFFTCLRLQDSLNIIQSIEKLSEMEVKYETGKKEEELKRMGAEKEITDLKAKQSRVWLIATSAGILFVLVIAAILFKQSQKRKEANKLLQYQNDEIAHQKKEITDSINYAKRIQLAILPPDKMVKRLLPNAFVLYKPKDVVSGDFYWMEEKNGIVLFAAVDCTGHGVPGAMMSVVGLNLLNQAVKEKGLTVPSEILKHLDTGVTDTLRQSADKDSIKDGMDLSLCAFNPKTLELQYAGAFNNLWVVRKNISSSYKPQTKNEVFFEEHLLEIKADKFPIGSNVDGVADNYNNYKLQLQKGDCVYLYSDGFADQFGGPKGKKFKYKQLEELLLTNSQLAMEEQKKKLDTAFEAWRGNLEQVDDVCIIGLKI